MSVFELIEAVRAAGGDLRIVGDSIRVEASAPLPPALIADLRSHKVAILAALDAGDDGLAADDYAERCAIAEHDGGIPAAWVAGFARLDPARPPIDVPPARWLCFIDDLGTFLDQWAAKASALGWGPLDLFGCDGTKPFARIDRAGLIWLINGGKVLALAAGSAAIKAASGARLTFYRRPDTRGCVMAWEVE